MNTRRRILHFVAPALLLGSPAKVTQAAVTRATPACPSCVQSQNLMTEGLIGLRFKNQAKNQAKNRDLAFKSLEEGFKVAVEPWRKAEFAALLAQAPEKAIHHRKHHYAAYALEHHRGLDHADRSKLLLILGDGAFDQGNVALAQKSYARVLELQGASARDREYATFKQGWTLLNQKAPLKAYDIWSSWLQKYAEDAGLREEMVQAASRAWVESLGARPWVKLARTDEERAAEVSGMRRSLVRLPIEQSQHVVGAAKLSDPEFRFEVLKDWWKYRGPSKHACEYFPLIQELSGVSVKFKLSESLAQELRTDGLRCLKAQFEKRSRRVEVLEPWIVVLERLEPKGLEWWSLSAIYSKLGRSDAACRSAVSALKELPSQSSLSESDQEQLWVSAHQSCERCVASRCDSKNFATELGNLLADSTLWNQRWERSRGQMRPELAVALRLAQSDEVLRAWLPKFIKLHAEVSIAPWFVQWAWRNHGPRFAEIAGPTEWAAQLPVEQRIAWAQQWFAQAPGPQSELWGWMQRWLPWNGKDSPSQAVLKLWAMSQRVEGQEYLELIEKIGTTSTHDPRELAAQRWALGEWARLEKWETAWLQSPHIDQAVLQDPRLFESYLNPGFELALREQSVSIRQPGKVWAWLKHVADALRSERRIEEPAPWSPAHQKRVETIQGMVKDLAVWNRLVALRNEFEAIQDWGRMETLERKILKEMDRLKKVRQMYQSHPWAVPAMQQASRSAFVKTRDALAAAIERVTLDDPASQNQLQQVSAIVKTWEVGT